MSYLLIILLIVKFSGFLALHKMNTLPEVFGVLLNYEVHLCVFRQAR